MTTEPRAQSAPLRSESDIVHARRLVRDWTVELNFNLVDQTKLVTAASELARNTFIHGGGGSMRVEALHEGMKTGLRLTFEDQGPGIPDIALALQDGYTTGKGLGLGLGGAKRLCNEFDVVSKPGHGTKVAVARWRQC